MIDTTTERRCDFTDLIAYSCAHCRGHNTPVEPISDYDGLPKELDADGFAEALDATTGVPGGSDGAVRRELYRIAG